MEKMSIVDFGKYIEHQNKLLVEEKSRKYSLIDEETETGESQCFSVQSKLSAESVFQLLRSDDLDKKFMSPLHFKPKSPTPRLSASLGGSSERKVKIENPFRSQIFRSRLSFDKIEEENLQLRND